MKNKFKQKGLVGLLSFSILLTGSPYIQMIFANNNQEVEEYTSENEDPIQVHEHTEDCYKLITNCIHEHTDECYMNTEEPDSSILDEADEIVLENEEPVLNCKHECSIESGCITRILDCSYEKEHTDDFSDEEFNAMMPFTLADIEAYDNVDMSYHIPITYFTLEAKNENGNHCELEWEKGTEFVQGGLLQASTVPQVYNQEGKVHAYSNAHVGKTEVYYVGKLTVHNIDGENEYIFYTTDQHIDNRTVFSVLKPDEKISLVYDHGDYHNVNYQFKTNGKAEATGPEQWTLDEVFGKDRATTFIHGHEVGVNIKIPRGYTATVTVVDEKGANLLSNSIELGKMLTYYKTETGKNTILKVDDTIDYLKLEESFSFEATSDATVIVDYQKVEDLTFNAWLWVTTQKVGEKFDGNRIRLNGSKPTKDNTSFNIGHSFTWEFDGVTSDLYTWELDQLEINGERIRVPMVSLADTEELTSITELSTGTKVTLSVKANGGVNGRTGQRHYILKVDNCYEHITITGGNLVSNIHREFAMRRLEGMKDGKFYRVNTDTNKYVEFNLTQSSLIDRRNKGYNVNDPIKVKLADGYEDVHIAFTTKENELLQIDGNSEKEWNAIQYLNVVSGYEDKQYKYNQVSYDQWQSDDEGYWHFCGTQPLDTFMQKENKNGVILINIYADPIKYAIDYENGADDSSEADTKVGPSAENISNMPEFQKGGDNGYNIKTNPTALVSNQIPIDTTHQFVFDHWEILTVNEDKTGTTDQPKTDKNNNFEVVKVIPGEDIPVIAMNIEGLNDCVYYNGDKDRNVLTLRAAWKKVEENLPIPYIIRYYLIDGEKPKVMIEEHAHTANINATLVTNLYKDNNKTLSDSIMNVLQGANMFKHDYSKEGKWSIVEDQTKTMIESLTPEDNVIEITLQKETTSITVKKVWEDYMDTNRPSSITARLIQKESGKDDVIYEVDLNAGNDWEHTFNYLTKLDTITYQVEEVNTPENYVSKVEQSDTNEFIITNTKQTGQLTITKEVVIDGPSETISEEGDISNSEEFQFIIELSNRNYHETLTTGIGDIEFVDGVAHFTLTDKGSVTFNLPIGIAYDVKEVGADGYVTTTDTNSFGIIGVTPATVNFTNTKKVGNLTISKTVQKNIDDGIDKFNFTVKLSDKTVNGPYGDLTFKNGESNFTLKNGESKTIKGLTEGIEYEVIENDANQIGYTTSDSGNTKGIISKSDTESAIVSFTNRKIYSELKVEKVVVGNDEDQMQKFNFIVKANLHGKPINDNVEGEIEFANGIAKFQLEHGESKSALLPEGTTYEVIEVEEGMHGFSTIYVEEDGTLTEAGATVTVINTKEEELPTEKTGDLTVSKKVLEGDKNRYFTFTVNLLNSTLEGKYGDMEFINGKATFRLKNDEHIMATDLPVGVSYVVRESDNEGYEATFVNGKNSGEITEENVETITCMNMKKSDPSYPIYPTYPSKPKPNPDPNPVDPINPTEPTVPNPNDPVQPSNPEQPTKPDKPVIDNEPNTSAYTHLSTWIGLSIITFIMFIVTLYIAKSKFDI